MYKVANSASIHYSDFTVSMPNGMGSVPGTAPRPVGSWSVSGVRSSGLRKGLNIVRMNNGETKKIFK